jgi:hypothetical protein
MPTNFATKAWVESYAFLTNQGGTINGPLTVNGALHANSLTVSGTTALDGGTATTAATADNSTAIATTAYVKAQASTRVMQTYNPANPTGVTTTGAWRMMGLGTTATIRPAVSGTVLIIISGYLYHSAASGGMYAWGCIGTGAVPANGAAATGTTFPAYLIHTAALANAQTPFCTQAIFTGLTVGTLYWIDMQMQNTTAGTCAMGSPNIAAAEL